MNKQIARLHFITIDHPEVSHAEQAIRAYKAGCQWVQLRMKKASKAEIVEAVEEILPVANKHNAILLINDHVDIALETNAHGVHIGKMDMSPDEARNILGTNKIVGGTANTIEDIQRLALQKVDYIGLGPYRFTTTKKNLSPVLGTEGYQNILQQMTNIGIRLPVIAIGGILANDVSLIKPSGIHGIALAGAIVSGNQIEKNIQKFIELI